MSRNTSQDRSERTRTTSPSSNVLERSTTVESTARRDRVRRERRRSTSPSRNSTQSDGGSTAERRERPNRTSTNNRSRRHHRASVTGSNAEMAWSRVGKTPSSAKRAIGRETVASRQLKEMVQMPFTNETVEEGFDNLAAAHAQVDNFGGSQFVADGNAADGSPPFGDFSTNTAKKRMSSTAAIASNKDIDNVIAQFRQQCDIHLATLLELKNNITTTEKEVHIGSEKEKEFQQVRQWYSDLAQKHTKLQKEHQALQEEHVKLQEKYMNLKAASNPHESFVVNFPVDGDKKKSKEKKDKKSMGEVVWSRAVKPTGIAAGKVAGTVAGKVSKKLHQQLP